MNLIETRLQQLRIKMAEEKIEALWISQPDNLYYLSGCAGLEGYLLITAAKALMLTDFRYIEQAQRESPQFSLIRISGRMAEWLPGALAGLNIKRLGFDSNHLTVAAFEQLKAILDGLGIELQGTAGLVEGLRLVKQPDEIEKIVSAIKITDAVYDYIDAAFKAGMTELELAWEIEKFMRDKGSQSVPFELIVAAGANSALPHAKPAGYRIKSSDAVVIDIGSKVQYYGSDLTRTVCLKPDETFKKVYGIVLEAQQTAIAGIKAGMSGAEADSLARRVISAAGYGEYFGHSLGHGIGLVTHERPTLGPNSSDILGEGMVFTIEPGIYLPGWGGVRIEDDVVIENGRLRVLSSAKKQSAV
jgi:Xaa-Pro aminopeptidase